MPSTSSNKSAKSNSEDSKLKNELKQRKVESTSTVEPEAESTSTSKKSTTTTTTTTTTNTTNDIKSLDSIKLNYPIFHCASSSIPQEPYLAVGGGGGKSKTGVPNAITLFKWSDKENSSEFIMVDQMETEDCVPHIAFNESKNQLAYFIGSRVYILSYKNNRLEKYSDFDSNEGITIDKIDTSTPPSADKTPTISSQQFALDDIKTSELRMMKFNKIGDRLIIVDSKNFIRVFSLPSYEIVKVIKINQGEITDLDIHPASSHVATTSRDGSAKIINLMNGREEQTFKYKPNPKLAFRGCRFSNDGLYLYTAQSLPRTKQTTGCTVLSRWNFTNGNEELSKEVDTLHNTTFDLSPDSKIISIGNADSKIIAFNSETFKQLDKWEPHGFVITGTCFSPDSSTVFSSSADYTCKSHRIGSYSSNNSSYFKILFILAIIILIISVILGRLNQLE